MVESLSPREQEFLHASEKLHEHFAEFMNGVGQLDDSFLKRVILQLRDDDRAAQRSRTGDSERVSSIDGITGVHELFDGLANGTEIFKEPNSLVGKAMEKVEPTQTEQHLLGRRKFLEKVAGASLLTPVAGAVAGHKYADYREEATQNETVEVDGIKFHKRPEMSTPAEKLEATAVGFSVSAVIGAIIDVGARKLSNKTADQLNTSFQEIDKKFHDLGSRTNQRLLEAYVEMQPKKSHEGAAR